MAAAVPEEVEMLWGNASSHDFPFTVYVRASAPDFKFKQYCTGALLTLRWVVTSSHCINTELTEERLRLAIVTENLYVFAGTEVIGEPPLPRRGMQVRAVIQMILHPDVFLSEELGFSYDVELLKLNAHFRFTNAVKVIRLKDLLLSGAIPQILKLLAGIVDAKERLEFVVTQIRGVQHVATYPDALRRNYRQGHDVCLLYTSSVFLSTPSVQVIRLPSLGGWSPEVREMCLLLTWEDGQVLHWQYASIMNYRACDMASSEQERERLLCGEVLMDTPCATAESGGLLVCRRVLMGLLSGPVIAGPTNCRRFRFAHLGFYAAWLKDNIPALHRRRSSSLRWAEGGAATHSTPHALFVAALMLWFRTCALVFGADCCDRTTSGRSYTKSITID